MNNNFNNQSQMGADFARIQLASNANKVAKIIQTTAIIIIVAQILTIIINIVTFQVGNEVAELTSKKTPTKAELDLIATKSLSLAPYVLIAAAFSITVLVFTIITWVKQNKFNKELVLAGLNKYQVYPAVLIIIGVVGFFMGIITKILATSSLTQIMSIVLIIAYIVVAVLMLKQSQQIKKDFNQNA